jgi:hypothetical protein
MNIEETEKIGRLFLEEMWSKPDLNIFDKIFDPKYNPEWIQIDKIGSAQIKYEIKYFQSLFPDLKYKIIEIKGEEDKIWVRYEGHGTHLGKGWGFKPTGKKLIFEGAAILYINSEGKIINQWSAFCFYDVFDELGVVSIFLELSKYLYSMKK